VTQAYATHGKPSGAESSACEHCEESDSPEELPDPYSEWLSLSQNTIENNIQDTRWLPVLEQAAPLCLMLADKFADQHKFGKIGLSVLWTDDDQMAQLNNEFRQKPVPTNILSFPSSDKCPPANAKELVFLGDMALGYQTVAGEAVEQKKPIEHHIAHLFIHGLLHLTGYDHQQDQEAEEMEALEIAFLAEINIPNPYISGFHAKD
jgi:probable rRNA maturation factor